jgi:hypothetical protein
MENWVDVLGFEGLYQVSNLGKIKSMARTVVITSNLRKRIPDVTMNTKINWAGYETVQLSKNGKTKTISVHRIVALAFVPNPDNKPQVNHKFGIKTDNRASQLEWMTQSENNIHAIKTGLNIHTKGKNHPMFGTKRDFSLRNQNGLKNPSARMVMDTTSGAVMTITEAARKTKFSRKYVSSMLNGLYKNKTNFTFFIPLP